MRIIGLTGSIGMGKSFVAAEFRRCGVPVFDADAYVHAALSTQEIQEKVGVLFPRAMEQGTLNRSLIAKEIFGDKAKRWALEAILHPLVQKAQEGFIRLARKKGRKLVVLEIPLLFETGGEKRCDAVIVARCSRFLQERRVLSRASMTREKLASIRTIQLNDAIKCRKADFVIYTGLGKAHTRSVVRCIVEKVPTRKAKDE